MLPCAERAIWRAVLAVSRAERAIWRAVLAVFGRATALAIFADDRRTMLEARIAASERREGAE